MQHNSVSADCALLEVRVHDLRLAASIGAHPHEHGRRQMLRIAATLTLTAFPGDHLEETLDYGHIVSFAEMLAGRHIALIETFARELAEACLAVPRVRRAEITVEKPGALANGLASTRIILEKPGAEWTSRVPARAVLA